MFKTPTMKQNWIDEFTSSSLYRLDESVRMLQICMARLNPGNFWDRPNQASNSIGNLLLHLSGNIRQYVISGLGGAADTRYRDGEFLQDLHTDPKEVWANFLATVEEARDVIKQASEADLLGKKYVQGFHLSGMGMVLHAVEHLSYHTGQIAWAVKAAQNADLGFYDGTDLNLKNE